MTAKADRVRALLDNPELQDAFETVRQYWLSRIETLPLDAADGKDALYDIRKMLFLLRQVEQTLEKAVEDGNLEDFYATEQERPTFLGELKWLKKPNR